ncbi:protein TPX2 isoform X3 [Daucus carota subsp. sativus]|uniref:protein TPX2 isoform X3 n=1 Tax=Daucus carota subsp. sativus TaxID=79200 RepID=UPI0007EF2DF2|nr:PREDICTED: protein TPX2-like isoform X1 [Daucus carota subsp. sativus]
MDEEMQDFVEFDPDYEFDAARFYDFTRLESFSEAEEAQLWFRFAPSYPPSPFNVKVNWSEDCAVAEVVDCMSSDGGDTSEGGSTREIEDGGSEYYTEIDPDIEKLKSKPLSKSSKLKTSTFMKPTVSHLAKQSKERSQKFVTKAYERDTLIQPGFECEATKRQKLESGYQRKVAQLKHHAPLSHKSSKKVGSVETSSINHRSKVTIPREPDLETAQRAKNRRFRPKNASEGCQQGDQLPYTFKARPLNRKILEAPSLALPKRSKPKSPVFQMFQLKTMERAMQHSSASVLSAHDLNSVISSESTKDNGPLSESAFEQNHEALDRFKAGFSNKKFPSKRHTRVVWNNKNVPNIPTDLKEPAEKQPSEIPPIELFNKLSLKSECGTSIYKSKSDQVTKRSKENKPGSIQHEFKRILGKVNNCEGTRMNPDITYQHHMNRYIVVGSWAKP